MEPFNLLDRQGPGLNVPYSDEFVAYTEFSCISNVVKNIWYHFLCCLGKWINIMKKTDSWEISGSHSGEYEV
jgi:hypothetical protein